MNEWISVKDKLPNKKGEYLCYVKSSFGNWMKIASFSTNLEKVDKYDFRGQQRSGWYSYDSEWGYIEHNDITHWMPLPKAPKDEI